ncbi:hypothetical protein [Thermosediminibacter litoriperuensis]|uniref:Uncharacterized protein n=1 Tax=Thermosediminibacter litoriperuensis TaxID=291989 RepID=A0A5S5AJB5_9FIRM|nr:hypothetical protein [Thermosediminibacter litoriperuensis]TYP50909.1 hypothetical protein LZ11_01964 [Thermosediminibacter litoriperuensis]
MRDEIQKIQELFNEDVFKKINVKSSSGNPFAVILPLITLLISKNVAFTIEFQPETVNNFATLTITITPSQRVSFSVEFTICNPIII